MTDVKATLAERGGRYGTFDGHAEIAQRLKGITRHFEAVRACDLQPDQREALEMIMHKVARILNGDPTDWKKSMTLDQLWPILLTVALVELGQWWGVVALWAWLVWTRWK